jgi:16S rRNA (adenine1518-N6/adenine1519-N6)-dimethyltransferase
MENFEENPEENIVGNETENSKHNFNAKKSLGQNFLHAPNIISEMVHAGKISKDDFVLEVGPGKGALTSKLLESGARVIAVEKDDRAIPFLTEKFDSEIKNGQLKLIHGDILEFDPASHGLQKGSYIIIANIPYYISGEFLRKFMEMENTPTRIVVMLQKEVAKRITSEKESILSISIKIYGTPKYLVTVPRKLFRPIPNVDSAVLVIENISKNFFIESKIDEKYFFEILKAGFAHKRKVLIKNLEDKISKETLSMIWEKENISRTARAEDLSPEMWKKIVGNSK